MHLKNGRSYLEKLLVLRVKKPGTGTVLSKKLRGGALYIAMILGIIVGVILTMMILITTYNQRTITTYVQSSQLYYNLQSAFEIAGSGYFSDATNNTWIKNTVNDDSIKMNKRYWGAYLLLSAQTKNRHQLLSQSGIFGVCMTPDTGLFVSDNDRPVSLSGQVGFHANCYLPHGGIKPANIEGQSYVSMPQNADFIKKSTGLGFPEIGQSLIEGLRNQTQISASEELYNPQAAETNDRSFALSTLTWESSDATLTHLRLSNNIKIIAGDVQVDSSCHFNNIVLICKKVRFREGFKGRIHVIASDSIVTEKKCEFYFPSSFVLLPEGDGGNSVRYIQVGEDCRFFGGILAIDGSEGAGSNKVMVKLNAKSEINGLIYSGDYAHLEGKINATVICNKLLLKTPSAVYENHLLSCDIDPKKYGSSIAIPGLPDKKTRLICCAQTN